MTVAVALVSSDEDVAHEEKAKKSTRELKDIQSKTVMLTQEVAQRQAELDDKKVSDDGARLMELEEKEA